jgi:excisionase family DNA binding protein
VSAPTKKGRGVPVDHRRHETVAPLRQRSLEKRQHAASATTTISTGVMTLQEVADYLRIGRSTIHRLLKRNEIPAFRIGRHWRFKVEEIDKWLGHLLTVYGKR